MPTFNSARFIADAIASVLEQSFVDFEILIIDGGSRDHTREYVDRIAARDGRIRLIANDKDQGPAHARAVGIREAKGYYIAFLDADDYWLPDKLERQVAFMRETGARFSYTRYRCVSEDGQQVGCLVPMRKSYTYWEAVRHRGIGTLTVMIERNLLTEDAIGRWLPAGGEEYLWWLLILRKERVAYLLDMDLARYRNTVGSLSQNQVYTLRSVWNMYCTELGLPIGSAVWHYSSYVFDAGTRKIWLRVCGILSLLMGKNKK